MAEQWTETQLEQALAELHRRYPNLSGGMFRVLLKTAMKQVEPPNLQALIERGDAIIKALRDG